MEDCLEAFIGATEMQFDNRVKFGVGYTACYNIISAIYDKIPISLKYEDLFDSKTRLKEIFDQYGSEIGKLSYVTHKRLPEDKTHTVSIIRLFKGQEILLSQKTSTTLLCHCQQTAAEEAIYKLGKIGFKKTLPEIYKIIMP